MSTFIIWILLPGFVFFSLVDMKFICKWLRFHVTIAEKAYWHTFPSLIGYTDISVECGTSSIGLAIQICPVVYTGYNESLLILNHMLDKPECKGTLDELVTPPVVRFSFPINRTNACGSTFLVSRGWRWSKIVENPYVFSKHSLFFLSVLDLIVNILQTTSAAGTGIFADFSNIQTVNISGVVRSHDPTTGVVTYNAELKYYYSCAYPLEYLINNTQVEV